MTVAAPYFERIIALKRGAGYAASEIQSMSKRGQGLAKAAGIVAFLTVLSKILGFFRETSLAAVFGATADVDAFLVAQTIPLLLFSIVSYALTTTFIPIYSQIREENGQDKAALFTSSVMCLVLLVGFILVIAGEVFAETLVGLVAPGFDKDLTLLTAYLSRIIFPMMIFQMISGIMTGLLQANRNFAIPTIAGLFQNISIIGATILFGSGHGIVAVAIGALVGTILAVVIKTIALNKMGFRWRWFLDVRDPAVKRMLTLMLPAVLGAGATQLNVLVDRILASGLTEGRIAALNYAHKLAELAPGILGVSIVTVVYPTLSKMAARKEWKAFGEGVVNALNLIFFLLAPIGVGVLVLSEPLVRLAFERGVFDADATQQTAWALMFFCLGIAVSSMKRLMERVYFAMQDTRTPMVLGILTVGLNVVLNIMLVGSLEQGGLALGTSIATASSLILSIWVFHRKFPVRLQTRLLLSSFCRTGLASMLMGIVVWLASPWIMTMMAGAPGKLADMLYVTLAAILGCIVYGVLAWLIRAPELTFFLRTAMGSIKSVLARVG